MPSLRSYRRHAGSMFGRLSWVTTTAAATGPDAASQIVSRELLGVDLGPTMLSQGWAYVTSGAQNGEQRRLVTAPLDGETGTALVVSPFSGVLASGVEVELLAPIPADRDPVGVDGWRQYVNRALAKLNIRGRVALAASGAYRYPLTAYPWLADVAVIHGLLVDQGSSWGNAVPVPTGWEIVHDEETSYLETRAAVGAPTSLVLAVKRPADTRIKRGGTWTDTSGAADASGDDALTDDEDEAIPPVGIVATVAIREALLARHQWAPAGERRAWQLEEARWTAKALRAKIAYEGGTSRVTATRTGRTAGGVAVSDWAKGWP